MKIAFALVTLCSLALPAAASAEERGEDEELVKQISFALICNAKLGHISDVVVSRSQMDTSGHRQVKGIYRQTLSTGLQVGPLSQMSGDYSGAYAAVFDASDQLVALSWKVGLRKGQIGPECLR